YGFDGIVARPVLHHEAARVRLAPCDANAVDLLDLSHIQHDPLWMQRIALAREMLREVRVALPKAVQVSVGEPGEAHVIGAVVTGESAARQRIAIGVANGFRRSCRTGEISFAAGIAPPSVR